MTERDIEISEQAEAFADREFKGEIYWREAYESKLIELVRADERELCAAQLDFNAQAASNGGDEYIAALLWQEAEEIRARGNT